MKNIKFFGAGSGEVTGSCYLLKASDDSQYLVDFGMFQGKKEIEDLNYAPLGFNPATLKGVFLTHAHLDHCGRLPLLVFAGYFGKIYMTAPTAALVDVVLSDSAKIAQDNMTHAPLYTIEQVEKVLGMIEIVEYDKPFSVGSVEATFKDAGHILGSASVVLKDTKDGSSIAFSGDLGNTPEDIVRPTQYIDNADAVVMETTYGDKLHPKEDASAIIQEEINTIETSGGVLLIPAFSLERTQELLHILNHLKKDKKVRPDTPVFLDSPMGIRATTIFKSFKQFYNDELQAHTDDPFSFEGLVVTEESGDSRAIAHALEPKVIIAGSGMMNGGRILFHASNYLPESSTHVLFVGYQAEDTLGRKILYGAKGAVIHDKHVKIRARIREIKSMSSHADQSQLLTWLEHIQKNKQVFLTHGEESSRVGFGQKVHEKISSTTVVLPQNGQEFPLNS